ncbi:uncharacterized protein [Miscanthus floridulus]|uniref:uncharacterized protein n=1 Tax=Miscanthus floridulus TaxID=154761 RepID=UPI00345AA8ED
MKSQADKNRSERVFQVDDMIYLKLQPHIQSSVALRSNHKLSFRYFGPFQILEIIGKAAYKLDLPANAQIHLVVHVSQLKKHIPPNQVLEPIDIVAIDQSVALLPVQVLDVAMVRHGGTLKDRALVRWDKLLDSMSTWEDPQDMHRRYPTAWGQAASQAGGNVRNRLCTRKTLKSG